MSFKFQERGDVETIYTLRIVGLREKGGFITIAFVTVFGGALS
jgi:hypothetical protein